MDDLEAKEQRLRDELRKVASLVVAYSGGVDSAYLAYAAHRALHEVSTLDIDRVGGYPHAPRGFHNVRIRARTLLQEPESRGEVPPWKPANAMPARKTTGCGRT